MGQKSGPVKEPAEWVLAAEKIAYFSTGAEANGAAAFSKIGSVVAAGVPGLGPDGQWSVQPQPMGLYRFSDRLTSPLQACRRVAGKSMCRPRYSGWRDRNSPSVAIALCSGRV